MEKSELPKYMEKNELRKFLDASQKYGLENDHLIFTVLAYTGLRAGELCALEWQKIDFVNRTLSVKQTHYSKGNIRGYKLQPPKSGASIRDLIIDNDLCSILKKHKKAQSEYKLSCPEYHHRHFVLAFKGENAGYPYYVRRIEARMERLLKIAGLDEHFTPHSFRHTHTSLLAEAGVGLTEIMERLGHKDDAVTRAIYLHVTKEMKKEAAAKFSNFMKSF